MESAGENAVSLFRFGDPRTRIGADLILQRYQSLQRQVPLLYLTALAAFVGLHLATSGRLIGLTSPIVVVVILLIYRLILWVRRRGIELKPEDALKQLQVTFGFGAVFSVAFCVWALYLFEEAPRNRDFVIFFGGLASIGCAYGLSSFPKAARLPLFLLGLPLAVRATLTGESAFIGAGVTVFLIIILVSRALAAHNDELTELSKSRSETENERERALEAERAANEAKAKAIAVAATDHLTGLPNRRGFMAALDDLLARGSEGHLLAIMDLDGFKAINDGFGHGVGDAVLMLVGERLRSALGKGELCARVGGDEFLLLMGPCGSIQQAQDVGDKLCEALSRPVIVGHREFLVSAACGLAILSSEEDPSDALLRADTALYSAKNRGRGAAEVFSPAMDGLRRRRLHIEHALRDPIARSRIELAFQPIFNVHDRTIASVEALARWRDPYLGDVSPSEFIPLAEQTGAIGELSEELLERALSQALTWPSWVPLSFNLSAIQLCEPDLAPRIFALLARCGIPASRLEFEVTETALLVDFQTARESLTQLRAGGIKIVLDDFGAGYASISYLQEMQFDVVKIDGALVKMAPCVRSSELLLKGVIDLCTTLQVPCVAEHVETEEQLNLLEYFQCARAQGYLLCEPLGPDAVRLFLREASSQSISRGRGRTGGRLRLVQTK